MKTPTQSYAPGYKVSPQAPSRNEEGHFHDKLCLTCGKIIPPYREKHTKYCSSHCYPGYAKSKARHRLDPGRKLSTRSTIGSISEYLVAVDLLRNGFEVFKSLTPACSCDLICLKDNTFKRIEVKTGYYKDGIPRVGNMEKLIQNRKFEILAIVMDLDEIRYVPEIKKS